jgi:DNA-binding MarR family transcriptional regulator
VTRSAGTAVGAEAPPAATVDALRHVEHEVAVLLRRARRAVAERARRVHPDLQPVGYLVLTQVEADGPVRGSEICEVLQLDKGAVSRSLQHLTELDLLDREPDPADGRAVLFSVSADGRALLRAVDDERRAMLGERFADWCEDDLADVAQALHRYNATFDTDPAERP